MQDNYDLFKRPSEDSDKTDDQSKTKIFDKTIEELKNDENIVSENVENVREEEMTVKSSKSRKKKKKCLSTLTRLLILVLISAILAGVIIISMVDVLGLTFKKDVSTEIDIKSGYSTAQIANELNNKGVIKFPLLFRVYSKLLKADGTYQYGIYELKDSQSYSSIISSLQSPGASGEVVTLTIPEGYSIQQISSLMEENGVCSKSEFIQAVKNAEYDYDFIDNIPTHSVYYRLEGYLFPDTYQFFVNSDGQSGQSCAEKAVKKMLAQMDNVLTDEVLAQAEKRGYSIHEILTMASIVELEASGYPVEMAKVAQVFYNRLRWNDQPALLGSTPTSNYIDSRYDTNKYEGLPPGPLCSPSLEAINAALEPDTSVEADYFVTDKNMKFYYTSSLDEHNSLIQRLKSEGLWN